MIENASSNFNISEQGIGQEINFSANNSEIRHRLIELLEQKNELPAFPEILLKLQEIINNPQTGIRDISKLIEMDASLSGNILKLANSAFYSGLQPVESVTAALSKLGLERIKQFIFSIELSRLFKKERIVNYFRFWKHSLSVALFTQSLGNYTGASGQTREIAYFAGLMHDIGIMVFAFLIPKTYSSFLRTAYQSDESLEIQEKRVFGVSHQEIGAMFIERWWKINIRIINAVKYHHSPFESAEEDRLCAQLVNVANGVCNSQGFTHGLSSCYDGFKEGAWDGLGLSLSKVHIILEDVNRSMNESLELLGYGS